MKKGAEKCLSLMRRVTLIQSFDQGQPQYITGLPRFQGEIAMEYSKNAHIQKVCEIMNTLSPAHQYKVSAYAEVLQEIEQEQEAAKKGE